jgi:hypothetical protein
MKQELISQLESVAEKTGSSHYGPIQSIINKVENGVYTASEAEEALDVRASWPDFHVIDKIGRGVDLPIHGNRILKDLFEAGVSGSSHETNGFGEALAAWLFGGTVDTNNNCYDISVDDLPAEIKEGPSPQLNKQARSAFLASQSAEYRKLYRDYFNVVTAYMDVMDSLDRLPNSLAQALRSVADKINRFDTGHHSYTDVDEYAKISKLLYSYRDEIAEVVPEAEAGLDVIERVRLDELVENMLRRAQQEMFGVKGMPIIHIVEDDSVWEGVGSGSHTAYFITSPERFHNFYVLTRWNREQHHVKVTDADKKSKAPGGGSEELYSLALTLDEGQYAVANLDKTPPAGEPPYTINGVDVHVEDSIGRTLLIRRGEGTPRYDYGNRLRMPKDVLYQKPRAFFRMMNESRNGKFDKFSLAESLEALEFAYRVYGEVVENGYARIENLGPFDNLQAIVKSDDYTVRAMVQRIADSRGQNLTIDGESKDGVAYIKATELAPAIVTDNEREKAPDMEAATTEIMDGGLYMKTKKWWDDTVLENYKSPSKRVSKLTDWIRKTRGLEGKVVCEKTDDGGWIYRFVEEEEVMA